MNCAEVTEVLLNAGADVNAVDGEGDTALLHAASRSILENVNIKSIFSITFLHWNILFQQKQFNFKHESFIYIIEYFDAEVLSLLIQHGSDVNARNKENETPLDVAAHFSKSLRYSCIQTVWQNISNLLLFVHFV